MKIFEVVHLRAFEIYATVRMYANVRMYCVYKIERISKFSCVRGFRNILPSEKDKTSLLPNLMNVPQMHGSKTKTYNKRSAVIKSKIKPIVENLMAKKNTLR